MRRSPENSIDIQLIQFRCHLKKIFDNINRPQECEDDQNIKNEDIAGIIAHIEELGEKEMSLWNRYEYLAKEVVKAKVEDRSGLEKLRALAEQAGCGIERSSNTGCVDTMDTKQLFVSFVVDKISGIEMSLAVALEKPNEDGLRKDVQRNIRRSQFNTIQADCRSILN